MNIKLTPREIDVLNGLIAGETQGCIAHRLGVSRKTVCVYTASIRRKMKAQSTTAAVAEAVRRGVSSEESEQAE